MNEQEMHHLTDAEIEKLLSGIKDARLHAHLQTCEWCRERWQAEHLAHVFLRSAPWVPAPEALDQEVVNRLAGRQPGNNSSSTSALPVLILGSIAGFFLLALVVLGAGIAMSKVQQAILSFLGPLWLPVRVLFHVASNILHTILAVLAVLFGNPTALTGFVGVLGGLLLLIGLASWYLWIRFRGQYRANLISPSN